MAGEERPVYLRLREAIGEAILDGTYAEGETLPSVRAFAVERGANPLTVAKAYQTFQDEGLVVVRRGVGMFVADGARERLRRIERDAFLSEDWPRLRARIERLGLDVDDLLVRG